MLHSYISYIGIDEFSWLKVRGFSASTIFYLLEGIICFVASIHWWKEKHFQRAVGHRTGQTQTKSHREADTFMSRCDRLESNYPTRDRLYLICLKGRGHEFFASDFFMNQFSVSFLLLLNFLYTGFWSLAALTPKTILRRFFV